MTVPEKDSLDYNSNGPVETRIDATIPLEFAGLRFDQAVQKLLPEYSRSRIQSWMKSGHVLLDGVSASAKQKVWGGECVSVVPQAHPSEMPYQPEEIALDVVYEDDALLVINKPAGLVVHPGSGNWEGTLLNALLHHAAALSGVPRAGIVHRLDKDTSGLLVVAKTLQAQTSLVRQLQARSVKRQYMAIVQGEVLHDGKVDAPIGRHPTQRTKMAVVDTGKPAVTRYSVIERLDPYTFVRCELETGRTHQIRVHMQSVGHPLLGDPVYGPRSAGVPPALREEVRAFGRQALHAAALGLVHPVTGEPMSWDAPLPDDFNNILDSLRVYARDAREGRSE